MQLRDLFSLARLTDTAFSQAEVASIAAATENQAHPTQQLPEVEAPSQPPLVAALPDTDTNDEVDRIASAVDLAIALEDNQSL
jgi:hypothetical protein